MAGVRLEFAQFGHFDYFNIYRNSVSTAIENLGQPIGTSSTMYYEDLTVEPNRDYYYRVGVIRDSAEKFSEEFHVKTLVEFDPPYDLMVEFKNDETNRLELNWKVDGFVDEQRYYCSETPIDHENLPVPKAVLASDVRTYVDTEIEIGKTYYVRVCSVRNGIEKISSEVQVSTGDIYFNSVDLLIFADATTLPSSNIVDSSSHARAITNSGATIQNVNNVLPKFDDAILLLESSDKMSCAISPLLTNDLTIEFWCAIPSSAGNWPRLMTIGSSATISSETNQLNFQFSDTGRLEVYGYTGSQTMMSYDEIVAQQQQSFISTRLKHACFMRKNGIFYLFVDGILQSRNTQFTTYSINKNIINFHPEISGSVNKYINSFRITNGVARYNTSGFTVPSKKFLSY